MSRSSSFRASRPLDLSLASMVLVAALAAPHRAEAQNAPPPGVMLLGAAVSGVIENIDVADGSHVDAGQILVQINCDPLEEAIKARAAELAALQAAFDRARNGSRPDEIAIGEAAVGVSRARAEEAQDAYDRMSRLTLGLTVTQEQLFQVQREARVAAAQLEDSEKRLALLQAGARPEDLAEAEAKRDEAQAQLDEAKAQLDQCTVRAPAAGTVKIVATLGEFISTSVPTTLVRLTADNVSH
jgi:multidrug resistance efflux pump